MRLATINVTKLTKDRLLDVLTFALQHDVHLVCLQETRHYDKSVTWAKATLAKFGWSATFSDPPPPDNHNSVTNGGTAILWDSSLGRASPFLLETKVPHRSVALRFCDFAVTSVYGNAHIADSDWLDSVLLSCPPKCPNFVLGDLNWKGSLSKSLFHRWHLAPVISTTADDTSPTRCIANTTVDTLDTDHVPGIPHHKFVCYTAPIIVNGCSPQQLRERRCALYSWVRNSPFDADSASHADSARYDQACKSHPEPPEVSYPGDDCSDDGSVIHFSRTCTTVGMLGTLASSIVFNLLFRPVKLHLTARLSVPKVHPCLLAPRLQVHSAATTKQLWSDVCDGFIVGFLSVLSICPQLLLFMATT